MEALLNDIATSKKGNGSRHCLMPVGIREAVRKTEYVHHVFAGQEILTTICLILKYLNNEAYTIQYETRRHLKDFLDSIDKKHEENAANNIDLFHIYNAYQNIKAYFAEKDEEFNTEFTNRLLEDTKIVWEKISNTHHDDSGLLGTIIRRIAPTEKPSVRKKKCPLKRSLKNGQKPRRKTLKELSKKNKNRF